VKKKEAAVNDGVSEGEFSYCLLILFAFRGDQKSFAVFNYNAREDQRTKIGQRSLERNVFNCSFSALLLSLSLSLPLFLSVPRHIFRLFGALAKKKKTTTRSPSSVSKLSVRPSLAASPCVPNLHLRNPGSSRDKVRLVRSELNFAFDSRFTPVLVQVSAI